MMRAHGGGPRWAGDEPAVRADDGGRRVGWRSGQEMVASDGGRWWRLAVRAGDWGR